MKIFQVTNNPNGYASINFEDVDMASILKNGDVNLLQDKSFEWIIQEEAPTIPDCPFFIGALPIFKTDKLNEIATFPEVTNAATFKVNGINYTAFCPTAIIDGALDKDNSAIRYFRNGNIMSIDSYVFCNHMRYPLFFKISELNLFSFVTENFAKALNNCGFNNLELIECNITK